MLREVGNLREKQEFYEMQIYYMSSVSGIFGSGLMNTMKVNYLIDSEVILFSIFIMN
jgi:hypothetical protein